MVEEVTQKQAERRLNTTTLEKILHFKIIKTISCLHYDRIVFIYQLSMSTFSGNFTWDGLQSHNRAFEVLGNVIRQGKLFSSSEQSQDAPKEEEDTAGKIGS